MTIHKKVSRGRDMIGGGKMKDDHPQKGVARAVIVVLLALLALGVSAAPVYAGVSPEVGRNIGDNDYAIIGETNLVFVNSSGMPIPAGTLKGDWDYSIPIPFPNAGDVFDSSKEDELVAGRYNVEGDNGDTIKVNFREPELDITPEVGDVEFNWVTRGGEINLYTETNLEYIEGPLQNNISIKLSDPRGVRLYEINTVRLSDISVDSNGNLDLRINTTGMRTGTYTLSIETDPETNNGLDEEGPKISFEVRAKGVRIVEPEQDERTITVTEAKKLAIESTPRTNITLEITWGMPSSVSFKVSEGATEIVSGGKSNDDGKLELYAFFEVTGTFEITATEEIMGTSESVFIESVPYVAEITKPSTEINYIGVPITIGGTATAGDTVTIKIDGEKFADVERDGDSFEAPEKWQTEGESPRSYTLEIWVSPFSDPETDAPDDSKTIILLRGGLFAEPSVSFVARGDEFTINGIVPGRDRVDILTIAPDGGRGRGLDPLDIVEDTEGKLEDATGLTYETTGVDADGKFETEKIAVNRDIDLGTYTIIALNYGRDGEWGRSGESNLLKVISNNYAPDLAAKTTDQIMAIVKDRTIDASGTDDLLGLTTINVEPGFVTVDALADVPLGSDITVTGTTNRQIGTAITVTVEGADERTPDLKPKIAKAEENDKIYYNSFETTFATESANLGEYLVTVDDGDGHTASTTLSILQAVEPAVNVSATRPPTSEDAEVSPSVSETPAPTPTMRPTITPSEPPTMESTTMPGFLSLWIVLMILWFVIAIIIAVWIYRDAYERGQNRMLWVIIVLALSVVGLLIWLVRRPKKMGKI